MQGYAPPRARIVQVTISSRDISIALTKATGKADQPQVLQAGVGGIDADAAEVSDDTDGEDHSELAWRLRHIRRSVLKDVDGGLLAAGNDGSFMEDSLSALAKAVGNPGRFASARWAITPRLDVSYGARYARYDYLAHETLFSPRASITVTPLPRGSLRLRGTVSRREIAPGAQEFLLPSTGVWVAPGRTFSPVSTRAGFHPEQINHMEVAAEQPIADDVVIGMRVFRQQVNDQLVTLFGVSLPSTAGANIGHYYVGNAGDVDARGWCVSISRTVADAVHASIDYTQTDAEWLRPSPGSARVALVMPSPIRQH